MLFQAKSYTNLLGTAGFSDTLLTNHFTLYQGYVTNVNKINDRLKELREQNLTNVLEFAELKRRFGWEYNGMRLHELYFDNLTNGGITLDEKTTFYKAIETTFGSYENWLKEFKATGSMRGIGWTVLAYDKQSKNLFNTWINEHDIGVLVESKIILIMDVFEHAFVLDYGIKKADYIEAFIKAIDWKVVADRYNEHQ